MEMKYRGLRVVHAANFQLSRDGDSFWNTDVKFNQGLVQNGCYVFSFSLNDRARMHSIIRSKSLGKRGANHALVRTCRNVRPDALILGHGQYISRGTLESIRDAVPGIRIGYWYIDPLWDPAAVKHLHDRADLFDAICCTTGGELLRQFARRGCPAAFIPNPVDSAVERYQSFRNPNPMYDLVFLGRDKHAPDRREFLSKLVKTLPEMNAGIFGSLGNPLVFSPERENILASSRMGLNLNRRHDVELYSSDRMAQLTGNGLLTLVQSGAGLEQLYSSDEVVYYTDIDDLISQTRELLKDDERMRHIAQNGWKRAHDCYSHLSIGKFLLDLTFRDDDWKSVPWPQHVFWHSEEAPASQNQKRSAA